VTSQPSLLLMPAFGSNVLALRGGAENGGIS
jgi:hypothetical protein